MTFEVKDCLEEIEEEQIRSRIDHHNHKHTKERKVLEEEDQVRRK